MILDCLSLQERTLLQIIYDISQNETRENPMNYLTKLVVIKMREELRNKFIFSCTTRPGFVWVGVRYVLNKQFTANILFYETTMYYTFYFIRSYHL